MTPLPQSSHSRKIRALYAANLLISFHYFFVVYVNSSAMTRFVDERTVSLLYLIGSIASTILFLSFARLLSRFGNLRLTIGFIVLELCALVGLAVAGQASTAGMLLLLHLIVSPIIYLSLDIFLERLVHNEQTTGTVRGLFLTMLNIAQVSSPILVGLLLTRDEYWKAYAASAAFLLIAALIIMVRLPNTQEVPSARPSFRALAACVLARPAFRHVFAVQFLLRFFYAWMVIYTPLYLVRYIGLSWTEIGVIFTVMLLPFLLLELPLGRLADTRIGEREILALGFAFIAISVAAIPLLHTTAVVWWMATLFATRVGAACIDIASESYFFKHVDGSDTATISLFRIARPASFVLASGVASITLLILPLGDSFFVLAGVMLLGFIPVALLTDTR